MPDIKPKEPARVQTPDELLATLSAGAQAMVKAGKLDDSIGFLAIAVASTIVACHREQMRALGEVLGQTVHDLDEIIQKQSAKTRECIRTNQPE